MSPGIQTFAGSHGDATRRAVALVAERRPIADVLGRELAGDLVDPDAFADRLRAGFATLADPEYLVGQRHVAPGIGALHGVRAPLLAAVGRSLRAATRRDRPSRLLDVAARLLRERELEAHWLAFGILERTVPAEPEQSWQLLRSAATRAADWITVDSLARPYGRGILAEPRRWAELEQLVYSPSRWERRLVGSTVATIPHLDRREGRTPDVVRHGLDLIGQLIGDAEGDVKKSLSWALRTLAPLDPPATLAFLAAEADEAAGTGDGHRAWVIRDTLPRLAVPVGDALRARVGGIRTRPGAPSTSRASRIRAGFAGLGLDVPPSERLVVSRA